jgi:hypothetical protein
MVEIRGQRAVEGSDTKAESMTWSKQRRELRGRESRLIELSIRFLSEQRLKEAKRRVAMRQE